MPNSNTITLTYFIVSAVDVLIGLISAIRETFSKFNAKLIILNRSFALISMQIKGPLKNAKFCNISAASELITLISAKFVHITLIETLTQIEVSARISTFENE